MLVFSLVAHADTVALTSFTGGFAYSNVDNQDNTIGWQFLANQNLLVTSLGLYSPTAYGFTNKDSHPVGLWDAAGKLLASTTISQTGSTIDNFYFNAITPVKLKSGATYTLGALFFNDGDRYISSTTSRTTSSGITYLNGVYTDSTTLTDPKTNAVTFDGRFGPNLTYTVINATPEPSSLALLGTGVLGVIGAARRRFARV